MGICILYWSGVLAVSEVVLRFPGSALRAPRLWSSIKRVYVEHHGRIITLAYLNIRKYSHPAPSPRSSVRSCPPVTSYNTTEPDTLWCHNRDARSHAPLENAPQTSLCSGRQRCASLSLANSARFSVRCPAKITIDQDVWQEGLHALVILKVLDSFLDLCLFQPWANALPFYVKKEKRFSRCARENKAVDVALWGLSRRR
jgi:hypothetical protein